MGYLDNAGLAYFWGKVKAILPGGSSGGVPVGTIVIWSGTAEDIPDGWALCDGQDGRPDLRDKFVLGAGPNHAVGETGGSEEVTLTVAQMPEHHHGVGLINDSAQRYSTGNSVGAVTRMTLEYFTSGDTSTVGGSQPHNNMPPYYALCYIIKTAEDSGGGGASGESNPIGTVISFMGTSAPEGYLVCDGAEYGISQYPALASFFQAQFGTKNHFGGDGASTFAVPDMRNLFLRGYHGEAEEQLSGEIGARQEATIIPWIGSGGTGAPTGRIYWISPNKGTALDPVYPKNVDVKSKENPQYYGFCNGNEDLSPSPNDAGRDSYSYTSRPVNMAVLYCIKAVESTTGGNAVGEVYSTDETRVGTWIDGKPLYRKTFKTSHSAVSNKSWLDCGTIQDFEYGMVVNGTITVLSENNILNLQSSLFRTRITKNNGIVAFYPENFSSDVVTVSCITVEYTKTTD